MDGDYVLLVHHRKAGLWLPPGGHVDPDETPLQTAQREITEELGHDLPLLHPQPIMATRSTTVGAPPQHEDVTLWYAFQGSRDHDYDWDAREFHDVKWFAIDDLPDAREPKLPRFLAHLTTQKGD